MAKSRKAFIIAVFYDEMDNGRCKFDRNSFEEYLCGRNCWFAGVQHHPDEKEKQLHYHYCIEGNCNTKSCIIDQFGMSSRHFAPFNDSTYARHQAVRYLTHDDNPEKEQNLQVATNDTDKYEEYRTKVEPEEEQDDTQIYVDAVRVFEREMTISEFYVEHPDLITKPHVLKSHLDTLNKYTTHAWKYSPDNVIEKAMVKLYDGLRNPLWITYFLEHIEEYLKEARNDFEINQIDKEKDGYVFNHEGE